MHFDEARTIGLIFTPYHSIMDWTGRSTQHQRSFIYYTEEKLHTTAYKLLFPPSPRSASPRAAIQLSGTYFKPQTLYGSLFPT
jgi:hypothetical protein